MTHFFGGNILCNSAVPGKNFVNSVLNEIEFLFNFNLSEQTAFYCVFEINIRLLVSLWSFFFFNRTLGNWSGSRFFGQYYQLPKNVDSIFYLLLLNILVFLHGIQRNGPFLPQNWENTDKIIITSFNINRR